MRKLLCYDSRDYVASIGIVRPPEDYEEFVRMCQEMKELFAGLSEGPEVRVVTLISELGVPFGISAELGKRIVPRLTKLVSGKISLSAPAASATCPVIAGIAGEAIAQGLELALGCDIRIAVDQSLFGLPQVSWGLIPSDGGTQRLSRIIGRARALEMILSGRTLNSLEALEFGLLHRVVKSKDLNSVVRELAANIAAKGPIALRFAKEAVHRGLDMTLEQGLRLESDLYFQLQTTSDRTEGIKAHREKRSPRFENR